LITTSKSETRCSDCALRYFREDIKGAGLYFQIFDPIQRLGAITFIKRVDHLHDHHWMNAYLFAGARV